MLDIKEWLKTIGLPVANTTFKKAVSLPFIVFLEEDNTSGADELICIHDRSITVEFYSSNIDKNIEKLVENLLKEKCIKYIKNRTWVDEDKFFMTTYDFNLHEKGEI